MSYFDPPDKDTGISDRSPWGKSTHPMSGKREAELLRAREWIDAESSANEGRTTPAIETIRSQIDETIAGLKEPA